MNFYLDYNSILFSHSFLAQLFWLVHKTYKAETHAYCYGAAEATQIVEDAEQMLLMGPLQEELIP